MKTESGAKKNLVFLGIIIVVAGLAWWLLRKSKQAPSIEQPTLVQPTSPPANISVPTPNAVQTQASPPPEAQPSPAAGPALEQAGTPSPTGNNTAPAPGLGQTTFPPLAAIIPSIASLRKEVAADAHETPRALLTFSVKLGDRMDAAAGSSQATESLFGELENCVRDPEHKVAKTVRALCLLNAHKLAVRAPDTLGNRYDRLEASADQDVVKLAHTQY